MNQIIHIENSNLKKGIWLYFFLVIFEGALRKWILPELSNFILIIRDPLALYLLLLAGYHNILYFNKILFYMFFVVSLSFILTLTIGHENLIVAIYGARIFLIHFPMIFLIGTVFNREDVIDMGKVLLIISIPMVIIVVFQFFSPQTAWINRGIGGDLRGGGFSGAKGFFRPPATFSFITGTTSYFALLASFIFYFWIDKTKINKVLLFSATIALIVSIPFSISRTLFFQIIFSLTFTLIGLAVIREKINKAFYLVAVIAIILFVLSFFNIFSIGLEAFSSRFEIANKAEGGFEGVILNRYLGGLIKGLYSSSNQPVFGYGLGYGTNVGSIIITKQRLFLISEDEWGRIIGEMGPILGILLILLRVRMTLKLIFWSWSNLSKDNFLPWLLLSFVILILPQGQISQPTSLGFCVISAGLLIASHNIPKQINMKNSNE